MAIGGPLWHSSVPPSTLGCGMVRRPPSGPLLFFVAERRGHALVPGAASSLLLCYVIGQSKSPAHAWED